MVKVPGKVGNVPTSINGAVIVIIFGLEAVFRAALSSALAITVVGVLALLVVFTAGGTKLSLILHPVKIIKVTAIISRIDFSCFFIIFILVIKKEVFVRLV